MSSPPPRLPDPPGDRELRQEGIQRFDGPQQSGGGVGYGAGYGAPMDAPPPNGVPDRRRALSPVVLAAAGAVLVLILLALILIVL